MKTKPDKTRQFFTIVLDKTNYQAFILLMEALAKYEKFITVENYSDKVKVTFRDTTPEQVKQILNYINLNE